MTKKDTADIRELSPEALSTTLVRPLTEAEMQKAAGGRRMETEKDPVFVILGGQM
jgi:hypothetical protein